MLIKPVVLVRSQMVITELELMQKKADMFKKYFCLVAEEKAPSVLINDANEILPALTVNCEKNRYVGTGTGTRTLVYDGQR